MEDKLAGLNPFSKTGQTAVQQASAAEEAERLGASRVCCLTAPGAGLPCMAIHTCRPWRCIRVVLAECSTRCRMSPVEPRPDCVGLQDAAQGSSDDSSSWDALAGSPAKAVL